MTQDITIVLIILSVSVVLFVTEWIRVDVVAMLVLASLAITGVLTPEEALSGFSNTAVITVWAILILSAALSRTGVAGLIGGRILALAGTSEPAPDRDHHADRRYPVWLHELHRCGSVILTGSD